MNVLHLFYKWVLKQPAPFLRKLLLKVRLHYLFNKLDLFSIDPILILFFFEYFLIFWKLSSLNILEINVYLISSIFLRLWYLNNRVMTCGNIYVEDRLKDPFTFIFIPSFIFLIFTFFWILSIFLYRCYWSSGIAQCPNSFRKCGQSGDGLLWHHVASCHKLKLKILKKISVKKFWRFVSNDFILLFPMYSFFIKFSLLRYCNIL